MKKWTNWRRSNYDFFADKLSRLPAGLTLLDLGSGEEHFADLTRRFRCVSVDHENYGKTDIVADLNEPLPFEDGRADIVFLSNVLEHIPDTKKFLSECHRVLKQDGIILATIPFMVHLHQPPHDFNRYTHYALKRFLELSGFADIEIKPLNRPVNLYMGMTDKFFVYLKKTTGKSLAFLVARFLSRALLFSFYWLYKKAEPHPNFTQGYGFFARKI